MEAFHRGDMDALGDAVDAALPTVWRLARRGFLTEVDGLEAYVQGAASPDVAERLVIRIIAACLTPDRRRRHADAAAFDQALLEEAKVKMLAHAERAGTLVTLVDENEKAQVPPHVQNLDQVIEGHEVLDPEDPPSAVGEEQEAEARIAVCDAAVAKLDERRQRIVKLRFEEGMSAKACAEVLTCGSAAVTEHVRRIRHHVRHALRASDPDTKPGLATIDGLLAKRPLAPLPPAITRERLQSEVLKRTFQDEPRSYGVRLAWGLGAAAIAGALWLLMFSGVLPSYGDDTYPTPGVELSCKPACKPGEQTRVSVVAPRDARRVAVALAMEGQPPVPLLVSPTGRSIDLPFGARSAAVDVPYPATIPDGLRPNQRVWAVAHFSEARLDPDQIRALTEGKTSIDGVLTTSTAIALR